MVSSKTLKIAAIVPRYDKNIGGGAETLIQSLMEDLANTKLSDYENKTIEVWTTAAKDHRTWENYYKSGKTQIEGVTVRRFLVDSRNLDVFIKRELEIAEKKPLLPKEQIEWLEQGVNSTSLYNHILKNGKDFDALLFAPYLFSTTFFGALLSKENAILVPCLHDENYAYLGVIEHLFSKVRGLIFNASPEKDLAERLYALDDFEDKSFLVGMGFNEKEYNKKSVDRAFLGLKEKNKLLSNPYILYAGRKEEGKNLDLLIDYYSYFRKGSDSKIIPSLVIVGSGDINFLEVLPKGVIDLGFVTEEEKEALMQNALFLCQPSVNESFSIVMMEAWLKKTPVMVNSNCEVTKHHVATSGGGFLFGSKKQFSYNVKKILKDPSLREIKGEAGRKYVKNIYSKKAVRERFLSALKKFKLIN